MEYLILLLAGVFSALFIFAAPIRLTNQLVGYTLLSTSLLQPNHQITDDYAERVASRIKNHYPYNRSISLRESMLVSLALTGASSTLMFATGNTFVSVLVLFILSLGYLDLRTTWLPVYPLIAIGSLLFGTALSGGHPLFLSTGDVLAGGLISGLMLISLSYLRRQKADMFAEGDVALILSGSMLVGPEIVFVILAAVGFHFLMLPILIRLSGIPGSEPSGSAPFGPALALSLTAFAINALLF